MKPARGQLTRRVAMVCGVMLAGLLVTWLAVLGLGISIPLDGFRNPVETAISRALGREVYINGALGLRPTLDPTIVAHDLRIPSQAGQGELPRAGRVAVRLALVSLLRGEPHAVRLLIEDASIDLDPRGAVADSTAPVEAGDANARVYTPALPTGAELLAQQPEFQELVLHRAALNYRDDSTGQTYQAKLDEVSVHTRPGQPLELKLRGHFQQQPYTILTASGGGAVLDISGPLGIVPANAISHLNVGLYGERVGDLAGWVCHPVRGGLHTAGPTGPCRGHRTAAVSPDTDRQNTAQR